MKKLCQKGFAYLVLILVFIAIIVSVSLVFIYVKSTLSNKNKVVSDNKSTSLNCKKENGLSMCLDSSKSSLSSTETTELKTTITNETNKDINQQFNDTCNSPSIILNGKDLSLDNLCGQSFTSITIKSHSTESFTYMLAGSKMIAGSNTIKSIWGAFESGEITVQQKNNTSTQHSLITKTICTDLCPQNTRTIQVYQGIDNQQACENINGQTIKDAAWGGYIGCRPKNEGDPAVIKL